MYVFWYMYTYIYICIYLFYIYIHMGNWTSEERKITGTDFSWFGSMWGGGMKVFIVFVTRFVYLAIHIGATYAHISALHILYISHVQPTVRAMYATISIIQEGWGGRRPPPPVETCFPKFAWFMDGLFSRLRMTYAQLMYCLNVVVCGFYI